MAQLRRFGGWLLLLVAALTAVQPLLSGGAVPTKSWASGQVILPIVITAAGGQQ